MQLLDANGAPTTDAPAIVQQCRRSFLHVGGRPRRATGVLQRPAAALSGAAAHHDPDVQARERRAVALRRGAADLDRRLEYEGIDRRVLLDPADHRHSRVSRACWHVSDRTARSLEAGRARAVSGLRQSTAPLKPPNRTLLSERTLEAPCRASQRRDLTQPPHQPAPPCTAAGSDGV